MKTSTLFLLLGLGFSVGLATHWVNAEVALQQTGIGVVIFAVLFTALHLVDELLNWILNSFKFKRAFFQFVWYGGHKKHNKEPHGHVDSKKEVRKEAGSAEVEDDETPYDG